MPDKHYLLWTKDPELYDDEYTPELLCVSFSKDYIEEIQAYRDKNGFHNYFIQEIRDVKSDLFEEIKKTYKTVYYGTYYNGQISVNKVDHIVAIHRDMNHTLCLDQVRIDNVHGESDSVYRVYFLAYESCDAKKTAKDLFETYLKGVGTDEL